MKNPRSQQIARVGGLHLLVVLLATPFLVACDGSPSEMNTENEKPTLSAIALSPPSATVQTGGQVQFSANGQMSDGTTAPLAVTYTATGGTISAAGLFTAGNAAGTFGVTAQDPVTGRTASAPITVNAVAPSVRLTRVTLSPRTANLQAGGTAQFSATGTMSDGSTRAVSVTYTATGGTINSGGFFTAGAVAGAYRVVGTEPSTGLADTATVNVAVNPPGGTYTTVVADDWKGYRSRADLKAAGKFWWWATGEDVYQNIDLVSDRTFGQVVRVKFQGGQDYHHAPQMTENLPRLIDKLWLRFRIRFEPGFTTVGSTPAGWANSHKLVFWLWEGFDGRGEIEYSNTDQYIPAWYVNTKSGQKINFSESVLPGSAPNFGHVATEWTDGEWYEFVIYHEKTSATTARQRWWRRKLTNGGQIVSTNPWTYVGLQFSGGTVPSVRAIQLGGNRNKDIPKDIYFSWGPWEVVDGNQYPNPWAMPNVP